MLVRVYSYLLSAISSSESRILITSIDVDKGTFISSAEVCSIVIFVVIVSTDIISRSMARVFIANLDS